MLCRARLVGDCGLMNNAGRAAPVISFSRRLLAWAGCKTGVRCWVSLGLGVGGTSLRRSRGSQFDVTARTPQSRPHLQSRPGQATNVKMQGLGLHVFLFVKVTGSKQVSVSCIASGLCDLWCC
jgi:hypothetical protein